MQKLELRAFSQIALQNWKPKNNKSTNVFRRVNRIDKEESDVGRIDR